MKKQLLLCGLMACAVLAQAQPESVTGTTNHTHTHGHQALRRAAENLVWLPGTITNYYWNSWETNAWELSGQTTLKYSDQGLVISESGDNYEINYEYNENGQVSCQTSYEEGKPRAKREYAYDSVTGREIKETSYNYENGQWVEEESEEIRITRNEQGNMTQVSYWSGRYGKLELEGYSIYNYGSDGKINEIYNYDVDDNKEEVEFHLINIVWENTNGQLFVDDTNDMDLDDYFMGDNRLKSGTVLDFDGDGITVDVTAEYPDNNGSVKVEMVCGSEKIYSAALTVLDSYGSYEESEWQLEYDVRNGVIVKEYEYEYSESEKYDAYGICLEYTEESSDSNGYSYRSKRVTDVTYDPTYGYPLEAITKYGSNDGEMENDSRVVFSDYASYDSVEDLSVDSADVPVEYYNLQGVRVSTPSTGIYIRRQGNSVSKVLVK